MYSAYILNPEKLEKLNNMKNSIVGTSELIDSSGNVKPLDEKTVLNTNCYAYSLGIMYNHDCFSDYWSYTVGFTTNTHTCIHSDPDRLVEQIKCDLMFLGLKYRYIPLNGNVSIKSNEYLIKVFHIPPFPDYPKCNFHFIRQDPKTKLWFHKWGWFRQPEYCKPTSKYEGPSIGFEPNFIETPLFKCNPVCYFAIHY